MDADVSSSEGLHKEVSNSEILLTEGLGHRRILRAELVSDKIVDFLGACIWLKVYHLFQSATNRKP